MSGSEGCDWILNLVLFGCECWVIERFCRKFMEYRMGSAALFFVCYVLCFVFWSWLIIRYPAYYIQIVLASHMTSVGILMAFFEGDRKKKLFTAALLLCVRAALLNFCSSLFYMMSLAIHHARKPSFAVVGETEGMILDMLSYLVFFVVVSGMRRRLQMLFSVRMSQWHMTLTVCFALCTILIDLANWGATKGILLQTRDIGNLYDNQLLSHMEIAMLALILMCMAGGLTAGILRMSMEQQKKEQYERQISFYHMLEEQYAQMESVRHDWKNHIISIQELLRQRDWNRLEHYLERMSEKSGVDEGEETTGNRVVDALFYYKEQRAEKSGIAWRMRSSLSGFPETDEYDLCVLIGNMLDNAIEECERLPREQRFVETRMGMEKGFLVLEVTNRTAMKSVREMKQSRKEEPEQHGFGLKNMEEIVRERNGVLKKELNEDVFCLSVLLPLGKENPS